MGTWGVTIFSDDVASDVRHRWLELAGELQSGRQATKKLILESHDLLSDSDDRSVFWLSLAAVQWENGQLEKPVKEKAVKIIDSGEGLERWKENPNLLAKRKKALQIFRRKLLSLPPPLKKIPLPFRDFCDWVRGDVYSYRRTSGKLILLRVVGIWKSDGVWCKVGERVPMIEILDWQGKLLPPRNQIKRLKVRKDSSFYHHSRAVLFRMSKRDTKLSKFTRLGLKLEPLGKMAAKEEVNVTCGSLYARNLDRDLKYSYDNMR
jgi:hypothetical protein